MTPTLAYCRAEKRAHDRLLRLLGSGVKPLDDMRYRALREATAHAWANLPPAARAAIQEPTP